MASRRRNPSQRLAAQSVELAWAAPQVVAHRLTRMANAGSQPSARDRHEFARMGHEKVLAFAQSGMAFWMQMLRQQYAVVAVAADDGLGDGARRAAARAVVARGGRRGRPSAGRRSGAAARYSCSERQALERSVEPQNAATVTHIAILTFDGFNELDSIVALGILSRVRKPGWRVTLAAPRRP